MWWPIFISFSLKFEYFNLTFILTHIDLNNEILYHIYKTWYMYSLFCLQFIQHGNPSIDTKCPKWPSIFSVERNPVTMDTIDSGHPGGSSPAHWYDTWDRQTSQSFTNTAKGLRNAPGENNCFLNSAVQVGFIIRICKNIFLNYTKSSIVFYFVAIYLKKVHLL